MKAKGYFTVAINEAVTWSFPSEWDEQQRYNGWTFDTRADAETAVKLVFPRHEWKVIRIVSESPPRHYDGYPGAECN